MHSTKQIPSLQSIILSLLVTCSAQTAHAKSVYVITNHGASIIKVYDIQDDQIQYQATAENLQSQGLGAVGLALDPDSQILFITYEGSNIIEMFNAKSMISEENEGEFCKNLGKTINISCFSGGIYTDMLDSLANYRERKSVSRLELP